MLQHADADEALLIKFCLATGFRDREIRFATWRDIDFRNCVVRMTAKPIWKFKPKNYEERSVPVPATLIEQLRELKERSTAVLSDLVFPNTKGKPNSQHIPVIKVVADRAKLNCGQCVTKHGNRCDRGPYCQRLFLHKFRHTLRPSTCGMALTFAPCSNGWATVTSSRRWCISREFSPRTRSSR